MLWWLPPGADISAAEPEMLAAILDDMAYRGCVIQTFGDAQTVQNFGDALERCLALHATDARNFGSA